MEPTASPSPPTPSAAGASGDPGRVQAALDASTRRVLAWLDSATRDAGTAWGETPSRLPGWTRAHVLAHLVGNAAFVTWLLPTVRAEWSERLGHDIVGEVDGDERATLAWAIGRPIGAQRNGKPWPLLPDWD